MVNHIHIITSGNLDITSGWTGKYFARESLVVNTVRAMEHYKGITSIKEIKKQKDDYKITFYSDYTYEDLITPRTSKDSKRCAIIPVSVAEDLVVGFCE